MSKLVFILLSLVATSTFADTNANSNADAELVQALNEAGLASSPPTPAGNSLRVLEISCSESAPNAADANCIFTVSTEKVGQNVLKNTLSVNGSAASNVIDKMQGMGEPGLSFDITNLNCVYNTLPQYHQPYNPPFNPHWKCTYTAE